MVTADHRINRKCILGHFYNSRDPTPDWLANFAIAKISAGSIFTDSQNFGPRNNNLLYGMWWGKILANLANRLPFANILPTSIFLPT